MYQCKQLSSTEVRCRWAPASCALGALTRVGVTLFVARSFGRPGFRCIAMPLLPLRGGRLVYGSADGGESVHNSDARVNALMRAAAEDLHLAPHFVRSTSGPSPELCCAGDVEGHVGSDGRWVPVIQCHGRSDCLLWFH